VVNVLADDPFSGHLFVFRGKRGDYVKLLWWDGSGLSLFANYVHSYYTSFSFS
jgi:transposase